MNHNAFIRTISALALGLLTLVGCSSGSTSSSERSRLKIGAMPSVDYLPFAVANELGIYDSLGLDLEIERFYSPMDRDIALQTGSLDATISDFTSIMIQHAKGLPIRLGMQCDGAFFLIAGSGRDFTTTDSLRGKQIALSSNTVIEYATDLLLLQHDIKRDDITKVEVQKIPVRLEMLRSGQIDAAILPQPFAQIAMNAGLKPVPNVLGAGSPDSQITGLAVTEEVVSSKARAWALLIEGYKIAVERIHSFSGEEWAALLTQELGAEATSVPKMQYTSALYPELSTLEQVAAWLKGKGLIPDTYQPDSLIYKP